MTEPGDSTVERRRVAALAGHTGDEPAARDHLGDDDPAVRATALGALARMGRLTAADLARALGDPAPATRRRACELAATFPAAPDLLPALADPDPAVAETAAWALGEQGRQDGETVAALSGMARAHPDALCREAAVAALGAIGHPDGLPAILAATSDKPAVRRRAVIALAPFEGPEVEDALRRARTDRDWQVRQAAEDLTEPGPTAEDLSELPETAPEKQPPDAPVPPATAGGTESREQ